MVNKEKNIFIVWRNFQARVNSMKEEFNYEDIYFDKSYSNKKLRPLEYLIKSVKTLTYLMKKRPDIIWLQLPPTPLLYVAYFYKKIKPNVKVFSDCHNAMLRSPWINTPFARKLLNDISTYIIVHNDSVYEQAIESGLKKEKCIVLEDKSAEFSRENILLSNRFIKNNKPSVVFPASFNKDEPINELLKAANILSDVNFIITGNTQRAKGNHDLSIASNNVQFTGWISKDEYDSLIAYSDVILGLTLFEGIQLSVANEAVGFEKAMVLSDTQILKNLFYKGAIYTKSNKDSLVNSIQKAINNKQNLEIETKSLKIERLEKWLSQADSLKKEIDSYDFDKVSVHVEK